MSEKKLGIIYAILAFLFWGGISPIYFKEVSSVSPSEVLLHRILWSFTILIPLLIYQKEFKKFLGSFKNIKVVFYLFASTLLISINWLVFIWAVGNEKILEASLGYYINPLVNVLLGYLFLKERLSKNQYLAIIIALLAIIYELVLLGSLPIVSLILAFSFGFYGLIRKKVNLTSVIGLSIEITLLLPFALFYLYYLHINNSLSFLHIGLYMDLMLTLGGLITIIPLLLFNGAARRMKLTTLGFFQYIGPSVAFLIAVFVYKEDFSIDKFVTFSLIWVSLIVFSLNTLINIFKKRN